MKKVIVLLSTYNGEKYLGNQIESILNQDGINVTLCIRDDGSTDKTANILKRFAHLNNVTIKFGSNIGWRNSFFNLIYAAQPEENTFFAFADQDDEWLPDKLVSAIEKIGTNKPTVYHSNLSITDGKLNFIKNRFSDDYLPKNKMPSAFFDGIGTGATIVFNSAMLKKIQEYKTSEEMAHDAYVIALGHLLGNVVYDKTPHILYRRHSNAATGFGKTSNIQPSLISRYKRYAKMPKNSYSIRATELLKGYSKQISLVDRNFLKKVSNYQTNSKDKLSLLFTLKPLTSNLKDTLKIKYRILVNSL